MLATTYFKVLRKEKVLLRINIGVLFYSFVVSGIGAFFLERIWVVTVGVTSAIVIRDLIAEHFIEKELGIVSFGRKWLGVLSVIVYWIGMMLWGAGASLVLYGMIYAITNSNYYIKLNHICK